MSENNSFLVFSGTSSRYLAEKICKSLNCPLGNLVVTRFSDGEFAVSYEESIRGRDVFLVQSTFPNSDNLRQLVTLLLLFLTLVGHVKIEKTSLELVSEQSLLLTF